MDLEQRLSQGPLPIRPLWSDEQTQDLAHHVPRRARLRSLKQGAYLVAALMVGVIGLFVIDDNMTATGAVGASPIAHAPQHPPAATRPTLAEALQAPREQMTLADGTRVTLGAGSSFQVLTHSQDALVCSLGSGAAVLEVIPSLPRTFTVQTGNVTVSVIGTAFRLQRLGDQTQVAVERGQVRVAWQGGTQDLSAGAQGIFPPLAALPQKTEQPAARTSADESQQTWLQLAKIGDYQGAYRMFQQGEQKLRGAEELMLAADAARLSGHAAAAVPLLSRAYREFPYDSQAPLAAFTLGRILADQLGQARQAAEAFHAAYTLRPAGPLASDALAREVECLGRAGNNTRAKELAGKYQQLYPQGRHSAQMRKLVEPD